MFVVIDRRSLEIIEAAKRKRDLHPNGMAVVNIQDFRGLEEKHVLALYQKLTGNTKSRRQVTPDVLVGLRQALMEKVPAVRAIQAPSEVEGPVAMARHIFEKMAGKEPKEVMAACKDAGVNHNTARTQYYLWRKGHH